MTFGAEVVRFWKTAKCGRDTEWYKHTSLTKRVTLEPPTEDIDGRSEALWRLMHDSEDHARRSAVVTCYLDDSDSEHFGFIGGIVMHQEQYQKLSRSWDALLYRYRLECIHMQDFVRPHGRYIGMRHELKLSLFNDITRLIRNNRIYSLSFGVPLGAFEAIVPSAASKKFMRPYTFAFYMAVELNNAMCEHHHYGHRIAYVVDHGRFEDQLVQAHESALKWERYARIPTHIGPITFDSDTNNNALQAADVIVWAARRRTDDSDLPAECKALEKIFKHQTAPSGKATRPHFDSVIPTEGIKKFARDLDWWTAKRGKMPSALIEMLPDEPSLL